MHMHTDTHTLHAHSSKLGNPDNHLAFSGCTPTCELHIRTRFKQKSLLKPYPLRHNEKARRVAIASMAASPVSLPCPDVTYEVMG